MKQQFMTLLKKEIRETWMIGIVFLILGICYFFGGFYYIQIIFELPRQAEDWTNLPYPGFLVAYTLVMASISYCREFENNQINILRNLPISSKLLASVKIVNILLGMIPLTIVFAILFALENVNKNSINQNFDFQAVLLYLLSLLEVLIWGFFWSTHRINPFFALILTLFCAIIFPLFLFLWLKNSNALTSSLMEQYTNSTGVAIRLTILVIPFVCAMQRMTHWLTCIPPASPQFFISENDGSNNTNDQPSPQRKYDSNTKISSPFFALVFEGYKQSYKLFIPFIVFFIILCCSIILEQLGLFGYFHNITNKSGILFLYCGIAIVLLAFSFLPDFSKNNLLVLQRLGIRPGVFWWSRFLSFGGFLFLIFYLGFLSLLLQGFRLYPLTFTSFFRSEFFIYSLTLLACGFFCSAFFNHTITAIGATYLTTFYFFIWAIHNSTLDSFYGNIFNLIISLFIFYASWLLVKDRFCGKSCFWRKMYRSLLPIIPFSLITFVIFPAIDIYRIPLVPQYANNDFGKGEILWYLEGSFKGSDFFNNKKEFLKSHIKFWNQVTQLSPSQFPASKICEIESAIYEALNKQCPFLSKEELKREIDFLLSIPETRPSFEKQAQAVSGFYRKLGVPKTDDAYIFFGFNTSFNTNYWEKYRNQRILTNFGRQIANLGAYYESTFYRDQFPVNFSDYAKLLEENELSHQIRYGTKDQFTTYTIYEIRLTEVRRRVLLLKMALNLYKLEKGDWPLSLDKLVDAGYLKEIPTVPGTGNDHPVSFMYSADVYNFESENNPGKDNTANNTAQNTIQNITQNSAQKTADNVADNKNTTDKYLNNKKVNNEKKNSNSTVLKESDRKNKKSNEVAKGSSDHLNAEGKKLPKCYRFYIPEQNQKYFEQLQDLVGIHVKYSLDDCHPPLQQANPYEINEVLRLNGVYRKAFGEALDKSINETFRANLLAMIWTSEWSRDWEEKGKFLSFYNDGLVVSSPIIYVPSSKPEKVRYCGAETIYFFPGYWTCL